MSATQEISGFSCPLSFAQERLWFAHQVSPMDPTYHLVWTFHITGPLDTDALLRSLNHVIARHEVLRARFIAEHGKPVQWIARAMRLSLPVTDLRHLPELERERALLRHVADAERLPFDLGRGPLVSTSLLRLADDQHCLVLRLHHIVADAWSISVLLRELGTGYSEPPGSDSGPSLQYPDFAVWQRHQYESGALSQQQAYWRDKLAGARATRLTPDRPGPSTHPHQAGSQPLYLPAETMTALRALAAEQAVTPYMFLLAAFCVVLRGYCDRDDIVLGAPVADRPDPRLDDSIGPYINTVALRVDASGDPTFQELLDRIRDTCLDAQAHQDMPFEHVVHDLRPEQGAAPLVDVLFVLHGYGTPELRLADVHVQRIPRPPQPPPMELMVVLIDEGTRVHGRFDYAAELFDASTIVGMAESFLAVLEQAIGQPHRKLSELTPNGPVRQPVQQLPAPSRRADQPGTAATRQAIAMIWAETLGLDKVGADDDFFEIGGGSLIAVQIIARIQEQLGVELTVRQFFEHPTVSEQGALVDGS